MNAMKGTQSIAFSESPYLVSAGSVAGKKEGEGPLGKYFDIASEDDLFGEKTWELAEGTMQKLACKLALKNAGVQPEEVRYLFGGDLLRQGIATSMGAEELQIPVFGLFSGIFVGCWSMALAEILNIFPIFIRRIKILKCVPWLIFGMALGKSLGALLFFYKRW